MDSLDTNTGKFKCHTPLTWKHKPVSQLSFFSLDVGQEAVFEEVLAAGHVMHRAEQERKQQQQALLLEQMGALKQANQAFDSLDTGKFKCHTPLTWKHKAVSQLRVFLH
jgi:hypothetical protein